MRKLEKYVFGEMGISNLVFGVFLIIIALIIIIFECVYLSGFEAGNGTIIVESLSGFAIWNFVTLVFGIFGGYYIGRYVQTKFTKRRTELVKE